MKRLKVIIILSVFQIAISCGQTQVSKNFNSNDWKNWEETEGSMFDRLEMAKDLIKTDEIMLFDKIEVLELLGDPNSFDKNSITYFLGHSGNGINTGSLNILFNDKNKVIDLSITEN